jgi:thiamine biosynthesis lipoprotein
MSAVAAWSMVTFRAMGSPCRIVAPTHELARYGQELVVELESTWSRFDPRTEISEVNRHAGHLSIVSAVTYELIALAEHARSATGGIFNPLMLDQLVELGYDRTWNELAGEQGSMPAPAPAPVSASIDPIELYPEITAIRLPAGTRFDPGGIGKGMAGDMVAAALLESGAESVQIELGGDVRVAGPSWTGGPWQVQLDDSDHGAQHPATITLAEGGVATSSVVRRRWRRGPVDVHHLIDARTGQSASTDLDSVTTVAATLWWAEVVAKTAVIVGSSPARALLDRHEMTGVLVGSDPNNRYELVQRGTVAA